MLKTNTLKILILGLLLALPQLTLANGIISSTVKNPDPYSGNQSWFRYYESPGNVVKDAIILRILGNQGMSLSKDQADILTLITKVAVLVNTVWFAFTVKMKNYWAILLGISTLVIGIFIWISIFILLKKAKLAMKISPRSSSGGF